MKIYFDDGAYDTDDPRDMIYIAAKRNTLSVCARNIVGSSNLVTFSPDNKTIAIANRDGGIGIEIFDIKTLEITFSFVCINTDNTLYPTKRMKNAMRSLAFSPDGRTMYAYDSIGFLHAWNVNERAADEERIYHV